MINPRSLTGGLSFERGLIIRGEGEICFLLTRGVAYLLELVLIIKHTFDLVMNTL